MLSKTKTNTNNITSYFKVQEGETEQVFPCRCGGTHRGGYALEDWLHHNCFHKELITLPGIDDEGIMTALCIDCGEVFDILP